MHIDVISLLEKPTSVFDIEMCFDGILGGGYLNEQPLLSVAITTDDAESHAEQNIPVLRRQVDNNEMKTAKTFNPFSRAALKGMVKQFTYDLCSCKTE